MNDGRGDGTCFLLVDIIDKIQMNRIDYIFL